MPVLYPMSSASRVPRLINSVGPDPVLQSWGYADAYLRQPERHAQRPMAPFWYREPGLWLPLSCAIVRTQVTYRASDAPVTSLSTPSITTTSGNLVVVITRTGDAAPPTPTVSLLSDGTNAYTLISEDAVANPGLSIWYAKNITGVTHTIDATWTSAADGFQFVYAIEYSGLASTTPLDASASGTRHTTAATDLVTSSF